MSDTFADHNAFTLALLAGCAQPDTLVSPGAEFLNIIRMDAAEAVDGGRLDDEDRSDIAYELADAAVPVYTRNVWETFVDLAAYQEDDETGSMAAHIEAGEDMTRAAMVALYQIAARLYSALFDEADGGREEGSR